MPSHLHFDGTWYRRRAKTPNRGIATLFGTITLWRYLYQPIHGVERSIFPLEIRLGIETPAAPRPPWPSESPAGPSIRPRARCWRLCGVSTR